MSWWCCRPFPTARECLCTKLGGWRLGRSASHFTLPSMTFYLISWWFLFREAIRHENETNQILSNFIYSCDSFSMNSLFCSIVSRHNCVATIICCCLGMTAALNSVTRALHAPETWFSVFLCSLRIVKPISINYYASNIRLLLLAPVRLSFCLSIAVSLSREKIKFYVQFFFRFPFVVIRRRRAEKIIKTQKKIPPCDTISQSLFLSQPSLLSFRGCSGIKRKNNVFFTVSAGKESQICRT